jgi:hypothetical protein
VSRSQPLLVTVVAALAALVLWRTPLVYPLKIFVVFLHELSHGIAAVVTGGSIERIEISAAEGGVCYTRGGSRFLILSAGYLGSLLWGALLLVVAARTRADRQVLALLGVLTVVVTLVWVRSLFGFAYGLLAGAALVAVAAYLPEMVADGLLRVFGIVSCLYAVRDIADDLLFRSVPGSDADALAKLTHVPGLLWGLAWAALAVAGTVAALQVASTAETSLPAARPAIRR